MMRCRLYMYCFRYCNLDRENITVHMRSPLITTSSSCSAYMLTVLLLAPYISPSLFHRTTMPAHTPLPHPHAIAHLPIKIKHLPMIISRLLIRQQIRTNLPHLECDLLPLPTHHTTLFPLFFDLFSLTRRNLHRISQHTHIHTINLHN
jgi:hypothetical protein